MALLEDHHHLSSSNEFSNFVVYDTISATPFSSHGSSSTSFLVEENKVEEYGERTATRKRQSGEAGQGKKKRRRKPRVCKNKEEAENQRMIHITVERNRRKLMNEHLAVLRSLMPESYVQRGDQASIVGGAIEFVKELEQLLQCLEAQKLKLVHQGMAAQQSNKNNNEDELMMMMMMVMGSAPFSHFFVHPQFTWSQAPNKYASHHNKTNNNNQAAMADIEVTLIETHANLRILSRKSPKQLSKLLSGFQNLSLTILHLNVTSMDPLVLYSISAKVEEECQLGSVDDIASAVHNLLKMIEEEDSLCSLYGEVTKSTPSPLQDSLENSNTEYSLS
ncbi:transcription factor bHLH71-like isoform X1 [Arachis stenosperma]|uniref:transcription factor bHLH71-like isoform X1 n=1 Tax=Arachis stenosperma TaxID=217475 RepID=UPI0025ACAA37|nr:transcription factor bHLH71-like isoform X1 [Arachis stenosperma]